MKAKCIKEFSHGLGVKITRFKVGDTVDLSSADIRRYKKQGVVSTTKSMRIKSLPAEPQTAIKAIKKAKGKGG